MTASRESGSGGIFGHCRVGVNAWHLRTSTRAGVEDAVDFHDLISRCAIVAMK